ncbi:proteasome activator complex subunit 3 isoform X1 [Hydra vulgaris]|uniref:Proteasome activator complex subunit 3 n=1 Tax=Hydra vulgaris TaxID=6087 RepID=T2MET1_HYDVU|nr:proteasome activator complex subunit 3-like [Hydra vulgaris]
MSSSDYKFGNLNLKNAKEVSDYAAQIVVDTEKLVTHSIPDKIFALDKMIKDEFLVVKDVVQQNIEHFETLNSNSNHNDSFNDGIIMNSKKRKIDDEDQETLPHAAKSFPCNKRLLKLINIIKPEVQDMVEICEKMQMWIQLLIPKIEDGNNFGVSIQEEVLNEIHRIQSDSVTYLDSISRYYITRGKIASKIVKYPFLNDYKRAVKEIDDKEFMNLKFGINELKSNYLLILDLVSKNYEKIKKPRSSNNLNAMY